MIKIWLIKASAPICGTDTYYRAYSESNPEELEAWRDIEDNIIQELWDNYSWGLHLDDEEYETEEEEKHMTKPGKIGDVIVKYMPKKLQKKI